jgi:phage tail tape-measure protein
MKISEKYKKVEEYREIEEKIVEEVGSAATKIISKGIGALVGGAIGLTAGPAGAVVGAAAGEMLGEAVEIFIKKIPQISNAIHKVKQARDEKKRQKIKLKGSQNAAVISKKNQNRLSERLAALEYNPQKQEQDIISFVVAARNSKMAS